VQLQPMHFVKRPLHSPCTLQHLIFGLQDTCLSNLFPRQRAQPLIIEMHPAHAHTGHIAGQPSHGMYLPSSGAFMIMLSLLSSGPEHGAYTHAKDHNYCISTIENPSCWKAAVSAVESIHTTTSTAADSTCSILGSSGPSQQYAISSPCYWKEASHDTSSIELQLTRKGHSHHPPMQTHPNTAPVLCTHPSAPDLANNVTPGYTTL